MTLTLFLVLQVALIILKTMAIIHVSWLVVFIPLAVYLIEEVIQTCFAFLILKFWK